MLSLLFQAVQGYALKITILRLNAYVNYILVDDGCADVRDHSRRAHHSK